MIRMCSSFSVDFLNAGIKIGNKLYNVILSREQMNDLKRNKLSSTVAQELMLNPEFTKLGPDIPHEQWEVSIFYSFGVNNDGVI